MAVEKHPARVVRANGVDIRLQEFGDPKNPCVIGIHGANAPMMRWPEPFCRRIADSGRYLIVYDNRDTGHSTIFPAGKPGYDVRDLAKDAVGVLDALGVRRAHVFGHSMGGLISQHMAIFHGDRVLSALLCGTSPDPSAIGAAATGVGGDSAALPAPWPVAMALMAFLAKVDWSDEEQAIGAWMREDLDLMGTGDVRDEQAERELITRVVRDARDVASHRLNHPIAVASTPRWRDHLGDIRVPTLVFHGTEDACFPIAHGRALAKEIRGATIQEVPGMGQVIAPNSAYWARLADAVVEHTAH